MRLELIDREAPYVFRWPDQEETYEECLRYRVEGNDQDSRAGEFLVALGWRQSFGSNRRRILIFRNQNLVLVEFVGSDRWDELHDVIWLVQEPGSRKNVGALSSVDSDYHEFQLGPATEWVTGPWARKGIAIRLSEHDHAGMIRVALIRERHRKRSVAADGRAKTVAPQRAIKSPVEVDNAPESSQKSPDAGSDSDRDGIVVHRLLEFTRSVPRGNLIAAVTPEASSFVVENPFAFALATCLDRGTLAEIIWTIPHDMKRHLGHLDPGRLAEMSDDDLEACLRALPRKPRYLSDGARTVREISDLVVREFGGDASRIWSDRLAADVQRTFASVHGVGPGIASMAVLLLERVFGVHFSDLDHRTMDIKPDVHTVRVLHRLGMASEPKEQSAIEAARRMHPEYPGELDAALWMIGRQWCRAGSPVCPECAMREVCPWSRQAQESRR